MPHASSSAATALRDHAERHVFLILPELEAVERRVLALLELADGDRELAARETGLDDEAVRRAAARGRKALRRRRAPLASGARCEQAELLISDAHDAALHWRDRRWLDIHLDRCPRCREHEELLEEARAELRATFEPVEPAIEEPAAPPAPAPRDERARLRVVPPEPPAPPTPAEEPPVAPLPAATAPAKPPARRDAALRAARVAAIVLAVAALLAAIGSGISRPADRNGSQRAPWDGPDAPVVPPPPISGQ